MDQYFVLRSPGGDLFRVLPEELDLYVDTEWRFIARPPLPKHWHHLPILMAPENCSESRTLH